MDIFNIIRLVMDLIGLDLFLPIWDVDEDNIRHKSLVRRIGSKLPLKPAKRLTIQKHLLSVHSETESDTNLLKHMDCGSLADVGWINEDSFCSGIQSRSDVLRRKSLGPKFFVTSSFHDDSLPSPMISVSQTSGVGPSFSTPDPVALQKINHLEDELARLRQQIANIVIVQESSTRGASREPANSAPAVMCTAPPPCGAPPPPPPPPPPMPDMTPKKSVADIIKERRQQAGKDVGDSDNKSKTALKRPDMSEVLKGLGSVKLKAVERSPGGTPLRRQPKESDPSDAASLIAHALKKKFANTRPFYSPNKDNNQSYESSPENSPKVSAPTLVKPSQLRRRSGLFQNNLRVPSPLAEAN